MLLIVLTCVPVVNVLGGFYILGTQGQRMEDKMNEIPEALRRIVIKRFELY